MGVSTPSGVVSQGGPWPLLQPAVRLLSIAVQGSVSLRILDRRLFVLWSSRYVAGAKEDWADPERTLPVPGAAVPLIGVVRPLPQQAPSTERGGAATQLPPRRRTRSTTATQLHPDQEVGSAIPSSTTPAGRAMKRGEGPYGGVRPSPSPSSPAPPPHAPPPPAPHLCRKHGAVGPSRKQLKPGQDSRPGQGSRTRAHASVHAERGSRISVRLVQHIAGWAS